MEQLKKDLIKTLDVLQNYGFCKDHIAINKSGNPVRWDSPTANCFCIQGAIMKAIGTDIYENWNPIMQEIEKNLEPDIKNTLPEEYRLVEFNDHPDTKHHDMVHLVQKTIAMLT